VQPAPPPVQPPPGQYGGFTPPPAGSYAYPQQVPPQPSGEAIAALVCGIVAIWCFPVGFIAIWLGARARRAARENPERVGGEQLALVGMWVGGVVGTLSTLLLVAYIGFIVFIVGWGVATTP